MVYHIDIYLCKNTIDIKDINARSVLFSLPCPYQLSIWSVISSNFFYYVLGECYCVHLRMYTLPLVSISQFYIFPPRIFDLAIARIYHSPSNHVMCTLGFEHTLRFASRKAAE